MPSLPDPIFKRWIHFREEDKGESIVYRPAGYPFPPARGREGIEFRSDGAFIHYQIGPNDRSQAVTGRWKIIEPQTIEIKLPGPESGSVRIGYRQV